MIERQVSSLPVSIYYSFAPEDRVLLQALEKHLILLRRQGIIEDWQRGRVLPGSLTEEETLEHLRAARLVFLLISADFMASEICYEQELPLALKLQAEGQTRIVPIVLRPVDWHLAPFAALACLPANGEAVTEWASQDAAFEQIVQGIGEIIIELCGPLQVLTQGLVRSGRKNLPLKRQKLTDRSRFLSRVRNIWIVGVLESSLKREVALALGLEMLPSALAQPWPHLVFSVQEAPPLQGDLLGTYEAAGGDLLILGEPGAGKTTLLLQLASVLLERAEKDAEQAMPAVFPLSSWAVNPRQPLMNWLVNELHDRYQVPHRLGRIWLENNLVLPLLDGLDEVAEGERSACILAINQYRREHYGCSIVVCSRRREYFAQGERIELQRAVLVQPLNVQQIDTYLARAGERFAPLRRILQQDEMFRELIACPLLLSISTIAYGENDFVKISSEQIQEVRYQYLIKSYVEQMMKRRGVEDHYVVEQSNSWLSALAWQMKLHNQTVFYIERLSMSWLNSISIQKIYCASIVLIFMLIGGISGWLLCIVIGLIADVRNVLDLIEFVSIAGLGVTGGMISLSNLEMSTMEAFIWSWHIIRQMLLIIVLCVFVGAFMGGTDTHISLAVSPLIGAISGGVFGGIFGVLVSVLYSGLAESIPETKKFIKPNQPIWRSAQYALFLIIVCICFGIIFVFLKSRMGLVLVFGFGFLGAMGLGGLVSIEHLVLRLLLKMTGQMPWGLPRFLDAAADAGLLRKVGSGYMFMHALVLDYFAELAETVVSSDKR